MIKRIRESKHKGAFTLVVALLLIYTISSLLMILIFKEDTPIWKVLATSAISTYVGSYFIFFKKQKGFLYYKYQSREYKLGTTNFENSTIVERLESAEFENILDHNNSISFKSKTDKFTLTLEEGDFIKISSKPRFWIQILDQGQLYEQFNIIESEILGDSISSEDVSEL